MCYKYGYKIALFLYILAHLSPVYAEFEEDFQSIKQDLKHISLKGTPGRLVVFGDKSFPILTGEHKEKSYITVAAARYGKGRVIAYAHEGFLDLVSETNKQFNLQCFEWLADRKDKDFKIRTNHKSVQNKLKSEFKTTLTKTIVKHEGLYIINSHHLKSEKEVELLVQHVREGGSLLITGLGWAWQTYFSKGKSLDSEFLGNHLMHHFGMSFVDGSVKADQKGHYIFTHEVPEYLHLNHQLDQLKTSKVRLSMHQLELAILGLPLYGLTWMDEFSSWIKSHVPHKTNFEKPIKKENHLKRLKVLLDLKEMNRLEANEIVAHPSVSNFPGEPKQGYQLIDKTIEIKEIKPGWNSVGLYAVPGQVFELINDEKISHKFSCRVGAHSDKLFHLDVWKRFPQISFKTAIKGSHTKINSAFGGLIYFEFDKSLFGQSVTLQVKKVIPAAHYIHGLTKLEEWKKVLRHHSAPWAEIGSDKIIVTVPREMIVDLDRPDLLIDKWDEILDHCADLAQIPKDRPRAQRMVCDRQISAGYMHSGYPIMTWMDQEKNLVDLQNLIDGNWGFYHELGHNHQKPSWTFQGTTEVTCNLFSLYVFEKVCGIKPNTYERTSGKIRDLRVKKYLQKPNLELWKKNPWLALDMYVMLQQEFGWQPFKQIFADYEALEKTKHPKTEQAKHDQWMLRFSKKLKRDLSEFFVKWGFKLSPEVVAEVKEFPKWMPEEVLEVLNG